MAAAKCAEASDGGRRRREVLDGGQRAFRPGSPTRTTGGHGGTRERDARRSEGVVNATPAEAGTAGQGETPTPCRRGSCRSEPTTAEATGGRASRSDRGTVSVATSGGGVASSSSREGGGSGRATGGGAGEAGAGAGEMGAATAATAGGSGEAPVRGAAVGRRGPSMNRDGASRAHRRRSLRRRRPSMPGRASGRPTCAFSAAIAAAVGHRSSGRRCERLSGHVHESRRPGLLSPER